jgi:hypothetical protein
LPFNFSVLDGLANSEKRALPKSNIVLPFLEIAGGCVASAVDHLFLMCVRSGHVPVWRGITIFDYCVTEVVEISPKSKTNLPELFTLI